MVPISDITTESLQSSMDVLLNDKQPIYDAEHGITLSETKTIFYEIINLAWPIIMADVIQSIPVIINLKMAGILGTHELAAVSLGSMVFLFTGIPFMGMLTAMETLASQAFTGSNSKYKVGIYAQRTAWILMLCTVPIIMLCIDSENFLLLLKQDPILANKASLYLKFHTLTIPAFFLNEVVKKYLQVQGLSQPPFYISLITTPFQIFLVRQLVLPEYSNLGLIGLPISAATTAWLSLCLQLIYISQTKAKQCWGGLSLDAFKDWIPFLKLGLPGVIMISGLIWPIECISLAAAYFGPAALSAQAVTNATFQITLLIPAGIATGTSIRIGNLLGSKLPNRARHTSSFAIIFGSILGIVVSFLLVTNPTKVVHFFSSDPTVIKLATQTITVVGLSEIFIATNIIAGGILRGQGRQKLSAFFKITSGYGVALPLGFCLAWYAKLGLLGLWLGIGAAWGYAAIGEIIMVSRTDWLSEVTNCHDRILLASSFHNNDLTATSSTITSYGAV